ncbi:inactive phospholipase D5 [Aplochiton taeniatus]
MEVRSGRLPSGGLDLKGLGPGVTLVGSGALGGRPGSAVFTAVQQQDYSASVWLRRKDKLEHSQQKCIVIFALVCCFAVLVALIFSAVDLWGEEEDGITEENCGQNCSAILVENIPEDVSLADDGPSYLSLSEGFHDLLDRAVRSVEIVSPQWILNSSDYESIFLPSARQGRALLSKLHGLKARGVNLKIASGMIDSAELKALDKHGADVRYLNTTVLIRGVLHSTFWVVDRKHVYIGSASMDWKSLATRKELGVLVYNCSCLALDFHRVFSLYWQLQYKDFIPSIWSKRLFAIFHKDEPLQLTLNNTKAQAYVSSSPEVFCPRDRTRDLEAISHVIQDARSFIYIAITDYLPLIVKSPNSRYWSRIDGMLREAVILRNVRVRLLVSCREQTHPLTYNFVWSLKTLCMEKDNCSLEAKFFSPREQRDGSLQGINHNRFMVTDRAMYIGNLDWVGNEFTFNAGAGLVISQSEGVEERDSTLVQQLTAVFERDWFSQYTRTLQANKIPVCNTHHINRQAPLKTTHREDGLIPNETGHQELQPVSNITGDQDNGQVPIKSSHRDDLLAPLRATQPGESSGSAESFTGYL